MDTDLIIGLSKMAAALITAGLGIAAIFVNYHDDSGRLKGGGYAVLAGICVAGAVSMVTSYFETQKARKDDEEQLARNNALLRQINRTIQPISTLKILATLEIPPGHPSVEAYTTRLAQQIGERMDILNVVPLPQQRLTKGLITVQDTDGSLATVVISKDSDLWPRHTLDAEKTISALANFFCLSLHIRKDPINAEKFRPVSWEVDFEAACAPLQPDISFFWDVKKKKLEMSIDETIETKWWKTNGKVSSVVDLEGAQLFFTPLGSGTMSEAEAQKSPTAFDRNKLIRSTRMTFLRIETGPGRELHMPPGKFAKTGYDGGDTVFSIRMPRMEKDFPAFFADDDNKTR